MSNSDRAEVDTSVPIIDDNEVRGTVRIAPKVLIQLIETTVKAVPGVLEIISRKGKSKDDEPNGKAFDDGKVRVVVDGDQIDTDLAITLLQGSNVGTVTEAIRHEVGVAAGRMLGMTVRTVNIYVDNFSTGDE